MKDTILMEMETMVACTRVAAAAIEKSGYILEISMFRSLYNNSSR